MRDTETDVVNSKTDEASELPKKSESRKSQREHLLSPVSFNRLRELQEEIFTATEMTPSFRKLINALITEPNLQVLRETLLNEISE